MLRDKHVIPMKVCWYIRRCGYFGRVDREEWLRSRRTDDELWQLVVSWEVIV